MPFGRHGLRQGPRWYSGLCVVGASIFRRSAGLVNGERLVNIRPRPALPDDRVHVQRRATSSQAFPSKRGRGGGSGLSGGRSMGRFAPSRSMSGNWVAEQQLGRWTWLLGGRERSGPARARRLTRSRHNKPPRNLRTRTELRGRSQASYPDGGAPADPGGVVVSSGRVLVRRRRHSVAARSIRCRASAQAPRITHCATRVAGTPVVGARRSRVPGHCEWLTRLPDSTLRPSGGPDSLGAGEAFLGSPTIGCGATGAVRWASSTSDQWRKLLRACRR